MTKIPRAPSSAGMCGTFVVVRCWPGAVDNDPVEALAAAGEGAMVSLDIAATLLGIEKGALTLTPHWRQSAGSCVDFGSATVPT